ncbi:DUF4112 domain-containing protein [Lutibaculum baratangense]|uniref:DUF4112 domain-containing protein n=1 Tax=Lutibaculum baratangense AMV1 TaxID=631454 RepID=V4R8S6_9HYPH|nr:DUF4112 domain-containing protein [Lutibaculum baratangense]ESR22581.1 hypothetical protein N177_3717 [Lutibaculum baratangense AMV1]
MTYAHATGTRAGSPPDESALIEELEWLAHLLDSRWRVPGTNWRFGVDGLAGIIPGVGDVSTGLVSVYLVWRARELGLPFHVLARMGGNVLLDTTVGSIPILGSVFDFAFKANRRNMALMRRHLERRRA